MTDGISFIYGATGAPSDFWGTWRDPWPKKEPEFTNALAKGIYCLCEPSRLLDLIAHFIVFETDKDTGITIKKMCRYQQFRAVNKIYERAYEGKKARKGLIWHTQGSGKSLTMAYATLKLKAHYTSTEAANPSILVLTDRVDLDDQISTTFVACGLPNPTQVTSLKDLREAVHNASEGQVLLSTIQKFEGSKTPIQNSGKWIVLVDECHRSQEKDLGAYNPPPTRKSLLNKSGKFIETLKRLYLSPYMDESKRRVIDTPYEMRAALVFKVFEATKSVEAKQCLMKLMDSMTSVLVGDTDSLYSLLLKLDTSENLFSSAEKESFITRVKEVILETPSFISDCVTITELCDSFADSISGDEYEEIKDMLLSYDESFDDVQIKEASSVEELDEETQKINKVESFWGISFPNVTSAIANRIQAIEEEKEEMEKHTDPNDWEDLYAASSASNAEMDVQISQMFETLKN